jgi:hypothetical protein
MLIKLGFLSLAVLVGVSGSRAAEADNDTLYALGRAGDLPGLTARLNKGAE